jgi:dipeptidyl aminopeptidase/acylaminoacyl peptidase
MEDLWLYDLGRETLSRSTFQNGSFPLWTPDGKQITFQSFRLGGPTNMFWKAADGTGTAEPLLEGDLPHTAHSWSPDGKVLAFSERSPASGGDIRILPLEGDRKAQVFLKTPFNETGPVFSPDGRWLAYRSNESGRQEIYVQPFPATGAKWLISTEGGEEAVWARSGELFYRNGDKMMAVDITTDPTFTAGTPKLLFEGVYFSYGPRAEYDVTPDGQKFLMIKTGDPQVSELNVVENWFEELKRLVPTN